MFLPVKSAIGKMALLNLDQIFAFVETDKNSIIALAAGGATFELPYSLEKIEKMIELEGDEDE